MAEQTKKRLMTKDDETWEVGSKNTCKLPLIAIGTAKKDNEMKIFEIITVSTTLH